MQPNVSPAGEIDELPLKGVKVIELAHLIAGPYCGMLLAGEGAEVIKVEPPTGDLTRVREPLRHKDGVTMSGYFGALNRGKKCIVLDLKNAEGMVAFRRLLAGADVLVSNLRGGALERLGIHPDTLHREFPKLVIASISGFGLKNAGAFADRAGLAMVAEALSGTTSLTRDHEGNPVWCGFALGDIAAGTTAHSAILLALRNAERYGKGKVLDITLTESALPMVCVALARVQMADEALKAKASANNFHGVPYGAYPASDGYVNLGVNSDLFWRRLCVAMGKSELGTDERYATYLERAKRQKEVNAITEAFTRAHTRDEVTAKLIAVDVPVASILNLDEVLASDYFKSRGSLRAVDDGIGGQYFLPADPTGYERSDITPSVPKLGEHQNEVLGVHLGLDRAQIDALAKMGAFGKNCKYLFLNDIF
jgi:crotonobetainyl-CoA:carnitine CoA-transferase CaiB-like acyl-CoA transferase